MPVARRSPVRGLNAIAVWLSLRLFISAPFISAPFDLAHLSLWHYREVPFRRQAGIYPASHHRRPPPLKEILLSARRHASKRDLVPAVLGAPAKQARCG